MSYKVIKAPLIVDPEQSYLTSLEEDPAAQQVKPWLASDIERALRIIRSEGGFISCLVLSPSMGSEAVATLIQASFEHIFGAQIFFLCEPTKTKKDNEARALVTQQVLEKPMSYPEILEWVKNAASKSRKPRTPREKSRTRVVGTDEQFESVAASSLLIDGFLSMDVYVKLRDNRYVRIVAAGDALDDGRLQRYLRKGPHQLLPEKI